MKIQKLTSSKLFYNKWPYKITCIINGGSRLTYLDIDQVKLFCAGKASESMPTWSTPSWMRRINMSTEDKAQLLQFSEKVEPYLNLKKSKQGQIRAEGRHFNIFCKDLALLEIIHTAVEPWVTGVYGPTNQEELDFMLDNGYKKILRNVLPKGGFRYKVYFKWNTSIENKQDFLTWADQFPNNIKIENGSRAWMQGKSWCSIPIMYVKDDRTLTMAGLMFSGNIKRVDEFILRSSINTCLDQEQVCQHSVSA